MVTYCPIWQCGGKLHTVDSKRKGEESWQIPDFICNNCNGVYSFKKFEKVKRIDD